jgi:hypothetical protein
MDSRQNSFNLKQETEANMTTEPWKIATDQGCKWFLKQIPEIFWQIFPKAKSDMRFVNRQNHWKVSWMHLGMRTHKFRQLLWNNTDFRWIFKVPGDILWPYKVVKTNREPSHWKKHGEIPDNLHPWQTLILQYGHLHWHGSAKVMYAQYSQKIYFYKNNILFPGNL